MDASLESCFHARKELRTVQHVSCYGPNICIVEWFRNRAQRGPPEKCYLGRSPAGMGRNRGWSVSSKVIGGTLDSPRFRGRHISTCGCSMTVPLERPALALVSLTRRTLLPFCSLFCCSV